MSNIKIANSFLFSIYFQKYYFLNHVPGLFPVPFNSAQHAQDITRENRFGRIRRLLTLCWLHIESGFHFVSVFNNYLDFPAIVCKS